jgi:hypothetical protein
MLYREWRRDRVGVPEGQIRPGAGQVPQPGCVGSGLLYAHVLQCLVVYCKSIRYTDPSGKIQVKPPDKHLLRRWELAHGGKLNADIEVNV